jgi:cytochrome c-type biogenesis protein CcmH
MRPRLAGVTALALLLAATLPAFAISDPNEALTNPRQEARAVGIGKQLRCLVCQNESIEDSGADLAKDLRHIVRQQVAAGKTDRQVIDWMEARYGQFVLLDPPFEPATLLLWGSPFIALVIGGACVLLLRSRGTAPPPPLSEAERDRLGALLEP